MLSLRHAADSVVAGAMARFTLAFVIALVGCGGSTANAPASAPRAQRASAVQVGGDGQIDRARLDAVLDAGPGAFLGKLEVSAEHRDGRFAGYRIDRLVDAELFAGVDLLPGDVLLSVNGRAIERPEHAFEVWTALRVASELTVVLEREGLPRELRFAIVSP
jgi:type II secretory pathway component PulC